jgi:hypothetical protein
MERAALDRWGKGDPYGFWEISGLLWLISIRFNRGV